MSGNLLSEKGLVHFCLLIGLSVVLVAVGTAFFVWMPLWFAMGLCFPAVMTEVDNENSIGRFE